MGILTTHGICVHERIDELSRLGHPANERDWNTEVPVTGWLSTVIADHLVFRLARLNLDDSRGILADVEDHQIEAASFTAATIRGICRHDFAAHSDAFRQQ